MKKGWLWGLGLALLCSGCALLPEEDAGLKAPVLKNAVELSEKYKTEQVRREDMADRQQITARYILSEDTAYTFGVRGNLASLSVAVGDKVEPGMELATLRLSEQQERLPLAEADLQELLSEEEGLLGLWEIEERKLSLALVYEEISPELFAYKKRLLTSDFETRQEELKKKQEEREKEIENIKTALERGTLFATEEGIVYYVAQFSEVEIQETDLWSDWRSSRINRIEKDDVIVKTYKPENCHFEAKTVFVSAFHENEPVMLTLGDGRELETKVHIREDVLELYLVEPDPFLTMNQSATIELKLTEVPDVLTVTTSSINTSEKGEFVYVLLESGHIEVRYITTGTSIGGRTQVIEGLKEGEYVLLQ